MFLIYHAMHIVHTYDFGSNQVAVCPLLAVAASEKQQSPARIMEDIDDPRAQLEIPSLERLEAATAKNKENWFDKPLLPGNSRKYCKIVVCPFEAKNPRLGGSCDKCSKQSWAGAAVWSTESLMHCLGYLMQHGTHSEWHKLTASEAYLAIVENWHSLEWEMCEESFAEREAYKAAMAAEQQDKKRPAEQLDKKWSAEQAWAAEQDKKRATRARFEGDGSSDVQPQDSASQVGGETVAQVIADTVRQTLEAAAASSSGQLQPTPKVASWGSVGQPRPSSRPPAALASGVQTLSLGPSHVSVPVEKMKMMQDSLQRAEHAISASLAFTVEQSNKLAHERLIVQNAIEVISTITGTDSSHFSGLG